MIVGKIIETSEGLWKNRKNVRKNRWSATAVLSRSGCSVCVFILKAVKEYCSTRDRLELGRGSCTSPGEKVGWPIPVVKISQVPEDWGRTNTPGKAFVSNSVGKAFTLWPITQVSVLWSTHFHRDEIMADSQNGSTLLKRKINLIWESKWVS